MKTTILLAGIPAITRAIIIDIIASMTARPKCMSAPTRKDSKVAASTGPSTAPCGTCTVTFTASTPIRDMITTTEWPCLS